MTFSYCLVALWWSPCVTVNHRRDGGFSVFIKHRLGRWVSNGFQSHKPGYLQNPGPDKY